MKVLLYIFFIICVPFAHTQIPALKVESLVKRYEKSEKVLVFNFWSTWCKPCLEEIPIFITVTDTMKSRVALTLVSLDTKSSS